MPPKERFVRIREVMTTRVRTAAANDALSGIWQMLVDEKCHHIPIVEKNQPVGMISARDFVRLSRNDGGKKISSGAYEKKIAADVMSTDLKTAHVDDPVEVAIDRIGIGDIHALVVLDDEGALAGIVTNHDLFHYLTS